MNSSLAKYLAFRRALPPRPHLERVTIRARGLDFAVYRTPPVSGAISLCCINGGLIFGHELLWPALAPLATHRQLIFFDQRGRGHSATAPGMNASRIEFDAGDACAIRIALGHEQWDLFGHSWGGGIAMLAAAQDSAAVRRLVTVCAVGATGDWLPGLHNAALARLDGAQRDTLAAFDTRLLELPSIEYHAAYTKAFFPAYFADRDFARSIAPPTGTSVTGAIVAARLRREGYDWTSILRDLTTPTLVLHGAADILPTTVAEQSARLLRNARLQPMNEVGHNPFWEAPVEFFKHVEAFLSEAPPDP